MKTLNLNRREVFAISSTKEDPVNSPNFLLARSYYMTLNNARKMSTANYSEGVHCYIKTNGEYNCTSYQELTN